MVEVRTNRRLAAILASDVVGYSRMIANDEAGTLAALKRHREIVFDPAVAQYSGRIVKLIGDGALVEFSSVVDAVNCAIAIQRAISAETVAGPRILLRIGINLGDIVVDGDDIYGDGVNVAARLEPLAEAGGICVASIVNDSIGGRIDVGFTDGGEVQVKNIDRPIRVWKWHPTNSGENVGGPASPRPSERSTLPSLAVLPFQNMSGDAEQDYFADGVVEDIITALSRFRSFAVISRNSSFVYKGQAVDARQVGRDLGVGYVLEGSVRRSGKQVRVSAQLIEAATGAHLWAEKLDGTVEDIFDYQDRITEAVVGVIEPQIRTFEIERARRKRPESLDAYDFYLRALPHVYGMDPDGYAIALTLLGRAIALDPGFALALAYAAWTHEKRLTLALPPLGVDDAAECIRLARAATAAGPEDPIVQAIAGWLTIIILRDYDTGLASLRRALAANPNNIVVLNLTGTANEIAGDLDEASTCYQRALRLSPNAPDVFYSLSGEGEVQLLKGNYEAAIKWTRRSLATFNEWPMTYWALVAAYAHLDRMAEAEAALSKLLSIAPQTTVAYMQRIPWRYPERQAIMIEGLRKAGLPAG